MTVRPETTSAPGEWNLLFDSSGNTWPELQELLADVDCVLVRSELELEKDHVDGYGRALTPVLVQPGHPLGAITGGETARGIAAHWGLDDVTLGIYGFPPLPFSTRGWTRRGGITGVGHPVFWLPPESRAFGEEVFLSGRYPSHGRFLEHIRLCLELMVRGYIDLDTGDVQDALVTIGIDPTSPPWSTLDVALDDSLEDRPELCRDLALPLPEDASSSRVVSWWAAQRAVELVRSMHDFCLDAEHRDTNAYLFNAWSMADEATVPSVLEEFEKAGKHYAAQPTTESIADLLVAVEVTIEQIYTIAGNSALFMEDVPYVRAHGFVDVATAYTDVGLKKLGDELDQFKTVTKAALYATRGKSHEEISTALTAAWNELATVANRWIVRAKEAATKVSPVLRSEFTAPPPPPLELPPDVRAEIERINKAAEELAL